jgi:hypothetical protein
LLLRRHSERGEESLFGFSLRRFFVRHGFSLQPPKSIAVNAALAAEEPTFGFSRSHKGCL